MRCCTLQCSESSAVISKVYIELAGGPGFEPRDGRFFLPVRDAGSSDAQACLKPAITLSRKDWHSSANRAVLWSVPGDGRIPGSCPAGSMAEMGLRWWRRQAARTRMEDSDVKAFQQTNAPLKPSPQKPSLPGRHDQPRWRPQMIKRNKVGKARSKLAWSKCCIPRPARPSQR